MDPIEFTRQLIESNNFNWNEYEENTRRGGYPVEAFPLFLQEVIKELAKNVAAPYKLISGVVMSAVSLACQPFIEVEFPDGRKKPCSLYNLVLADSGSRKTTIHSLLMKPFIEYEKKQRKIYEDDLKLHESGMLIWKKRRKSF